jgi:hypothetical protein
MPRDVFTQLSDILASAADILSGGSDAFGGSSGVLDEGGGGAPPEGANVRFLDPANVSGTALDANNGLTVNTAWRTFQGALAAVPAGGVDIYVRQCEVAPAGTDYTDGATFIAQRNPTDWVNFRRYPGETYTIIRNATPKNPLIWSASKIRFYNAIFKSRIVLGGNTSAATAPSFIEFWDTTFLQDSALRHGGILITSNAHDILFNGFDITNPDFSVAGSNQVHVTGENDTVQPPYNITFKNGYLHDTKNCDGFQVKYAHDILWEDITFERFQRQITGAEPDPHNDCFHIGVVGTGQNVYNLTLRRVRMKDYGATAFRLDKVFSNLLVENCIFPPNLTSDQEVEMAHGVNARFINCTIDSFTQTTDNDVDGTSLLLHGNVINGLSIQGTHLPTYQNYNMVPSGQIRGANDIAGVAWSTIFVNPATWDFRPKAGASIIDASSYTSPDGGTTVVPTIDIDSRTRGATPDMGAYERVAGDP